MAYSGKDVKTTGKLCVGDSSPMITGTGFVDGDAWILGRTQVGAGVISRAEVWGTSLFTVSSAGLGTTYAGTCSFDLTGGAYENLLTATAIGGWTFAAADVGKIIILTGGTYIGGVARIAEVISTTEVTLETCGWDADLAAGTTFIWCETRHSFTSPALKINNIGATSQWINNALDHTGQYANKYKTTSAGAGVTGSRHEFEANGYANNDAIQIKHTVGALAAGEVQKVVRVTIDDSGCAGGSTVDIDGYKFNRIKGSSTASVCAVHVGTEFTDALCVDGSPPINPGYGYAFTALFAVTDHVNSGGGGNDSFINAAVNTQLFTADNTGILIGSDNPFSVIQYIEQVVGSGSITPTWQYSTGDGTWATLVVSDTTGGMRRSGKVSFTAPGGWAKTSHCNGVTGVITEAYYVRITRTANALATPPTEQYFKIYVGGSATESNIRGDGTWKPPQLADASAANESVYYSTDASKLVYKDSGGTVRSLY